MYLCHRHRSRLSLGFKATSNPNYRGAVVQLSFGAHSAFHQWPNTAPSYLKFCLCTRDGGMTIREAQQRCYTAMLFASQPAGQGFGIAGVKLKTVSLVVLPNEARKALILGSAKQRLHLHVD